MTTIRFQGVEFPATWPTKTKSEVTFLPFKKEKKRRNEIRRNTDVTHSHGSHKVTMETKEGCVCELFFSSVVPGEPFLPHPGTLSAICWSRIAEIYEQPSLPSHMGEQ